MPFRADHLLSYAPSLHQPRKLDVTVPWARRRAGNRYNHDMSPGGDWVGTNTDRFEMRTPLPQPYPRSLTPRFNELRTSSPIETPIDNGDVQSVRRLLLR